MELYSLIISVLALIASVFTYLRHDKKLKEQERRINEYQLKQIEKEDLESKKRYEQKVLISLLCLSASFLASDIILFAFLPAPKPVKTAITSASTTPIISPITRNNMAFVVPIFFLLIFLIDNIISTI